MDAINTLRGILVAGAVVAALIAGSSGWWLAVLLLGAGILAHGVLWMHLHRERAVVEATTPPDA